jgi:two-component system, NtrC family, sensor histidine kinase HydH
MANSIDRRSRDRWLGIGLIVFLVLAITILHFKTDVKYTSLHQVYQRSYYIPIVLAGYLFEIVGGLATALSLSVLFLLHIWKDWSHHHPDYTFQQYAEIPMYFVIAILVGYLSRLQRKTTQKLQKAGNELEEAYKKLNDTFEQLRHADRLALLGQMSAGISHEIRNPLASIQGAVEILGQAVPTEDPRSEFAQIARKEVARLEKLTTEILQFSRPTPPEKRNTDSAEIIEAACRLVADQARRQKIELIRRIDQPVPTILVDPEQLKQVLINLLINATQAQPGGGQIVVSAKAESGEWIISVQDAGSGIPKEKLDRVFDPFFTTKKEGTGLGLSISYQLVKNNGGRIWVTSQPGQGSCFSIAFPILNSKPESS